MSIKRLTILKLMPFNFIRFRIVVFAVLPALLLDLACAPQGDANKAAAAKINVIGGRGTAPGEFSSPRALQALPNGDFLVIDRSGRVQRLTADGEFVMEWRLPAWENGTPTDLTLAADNTVWIADTHYHRLLHYDLDGKLLGQFGTYGDEEGKFIYPTSLAFDAEGNLYVCEYGEISRIQKFDLELKIIKSWGEAESLSRPMKIEVIKNAQGGEELLVADSCNHRIVRYTPDGRLIDTISIEGRGSGQSMFLYDLDVDDRGRIYACEYGNNRIQVFSPDGKALGTFGYAGVNPGELHNPWGVEVLKNGNVVVADTWNHRLQIFPPFK